MSQSPLDIPPATQPDIDDPYWDTKRGSDHEEDNEKKQEEEEEEEESEGPYTQLVMNGLDQLEFYFIPDQDISVEQRELLETINEYYHEQEDDEEEDSQEEEEEDDEDQSQEIKNQQRSAFKLIKELLADRHRWGMFLHDRSGSHLGLSISHLYWTGEIYSGAKATKYSKLELLTSLPIVRTAPGRNKRSSPGEKTVPKNAQKKVCRRASDDEEGIPLYVS